MNIKKQRFLDNKNKVSWTRKPQKQGFLDKKSEKQGFLETKKTKIKDFLDKTTKK